MPCAVKKDAECDFGLRKAGGLAMHWCPPRRSLTSPGDRWSKLAKGKTIPINATPLDDEAWQAQLQAYPEHKYLLGGGWS